MILRVERWHVGEVHRRGRLCEKCGQVNACTTLNLRERMTSEVACLEQETSFAPVIIHILQYFESLLTLTLYVARRGG